MKGSGQFIYIIFSLLGLSVLWRPGQGGGEVAARCSCQRATGSGGGGGGGEAGEEKGKVRRPVSLRLVGRPHLPRASPPPPPPPPGPFSPAPARPSEGGRPRARRACSGRGGLLQRREGNALRRAVRKVRSHGRATTHCRPNPRFIYSYGRRKPLPQPRRLPALLPALLPPRHRLR